MKIIKFLILIAILVVGVLGFLGVVPILSPLLGTDKPKNLGMAYSQENFDSATQKSKVETKVLDSSSPVSLSYEGSHEIADIFTDGELTALADNKNWADYPISDVQVRINDDNTCEVSGMIDLAKVDGLLTALNIAQGNYKKALESAKIPLIKLPFYAKGSGAISDNQINAAITKFEVGRLPIPTALVNKYSPSLMKFGETVISRVSGLSIKEARFENNSVRFEGTLPDIENLQQ